MKANRLLRAAVSIAAVWILLGATGCRAASETLLEEDWQTLKIGGAKAGYVYTVTRLVPDPEPTIVTSIFTETGIKRFGMALSIRTTVDFRETPEGQVKSVASRMLASNMETTTVGTVREGKMLIRTTSAGKVHESEIPWDSAVIGPYAQTRLTRQTDLQPGASLTFKIFLPEFQRAVSSTLTISGRETIEINGVMESLLRGAITQDILPGIETAVWLDDKGNVARTLTRVMGEVETLRSTREDAMKSAAPEEMADVMTGFLIRSNVVIPNVAKVREALYRIEAPEAALAQIRFDDRRQTVVKRERGAVELRVRPMGDADRKAPNPGAEFVQSAPYIQSDDPQIAATAQSVIRGARTPPEKARRLEQWVFRNLTKKDYSVGFASAREVFLSRRGDCSEHAVLLAAMLRAVGIPARVAVGVVYWKESFGYHMWTEAFLNDWTALDATLGADVVDATHVRFADAALTGINPAEPFIPLVGIIGDMKFTVLEIVSD